MSKPPAKSYVAKRLAVSVGGGGEDAVAAINAYLNRGWFLTKLFPYRDNLIAIFEIWVPEEEKESTP